MDIPKDFCHQDHGPVVCETVGDLIKQLKRLPRDLPIEQGFGDGVALVVYNVNHNNTHLSFEDTDDS